MSWEKEVEEIQRRQSLADELGGRNRADAFFQGIIAPRFRNRRAAVSAFVKRHLTQRHALLERRRRPRTCVKVD